MLASASPRRRELLSGLRLPFTVHPADVDETPLAGEAPAECVRRLALAKARTAAAGTGDADTLVLAADTLVVLDGRMLGKPRDAADARRMLALIAGRRHAVLTGVALLAGAREAAAVEESGVRMAAMTAAEIDWYVATGEPLDKAGAYAVQGQGALFVEAVEGNWSNVVGLPLPATYRLFAALGHDLLELMSSLAPGDGSRATVRR